MAYTKRADGRKLDELRPMEAKVGVVPEALGSAMFKIGKTVAIAAVYAPLDLPTPLQNPAKGRLRCNYNMMAFSGSGDRVRPGPSRRSKEISMITEKSLLPVLDLKDFAKTGVDVLIELIQTDAGTRCAGICAASLALADAGIPMRDLVSAIALGRIEDKIVVDVDKAEEDYEGGMADIPMAMATRTGEITLLQMDGDLSPADLKKALDQAKDACNKIKEVQLNALKEKYARGL